jgi:Ca2+-binding RTX toxin-like protein
MTGSAGLSTRAATARKGRNMPFYIPGTPGNDRLNGTPYDDDIFGFAGNDTVRAGSGDDYVEGGDGNDLLHGDAGNDWLVGGRGMDTYFGSTGFDAADFSLDPTGSTGGVTLDLGRTVSGPAGAYSVATCGRRAAPMPSKFTASRTCWARSATT